MNRYQLVDHGHTVLPDKCCTNPKISFLSQSLMVISLTTLLQKGISFPVPFWNVAIQSNNKAVV